MTPLTGNPPADGHGLDDAIRAQRLRSYAGNLVLAPLSALAVALLFAWTLWGLLATPWVGLWLGGMVLVQALRLAVGAWHRFTPAGRLAEGRWLWRYRACVALHGLAWTAACLLPARVPGPLLEALRGVMLVGVTAGGFALLAFDIPAALAFGLPVLGALCLHLWQFQGHEYLMLGLASLGTVLYLSIAAGQIGSVVRRYVVLQQHAERQADALRRSEARLAEKSAALEATLENINQGIGAVDRHGRVLVLNRRARELLDLPDSFDAVGLDYQAVQAFQVTRGDLPPDGYIDAAGRLQPLPSNPNEVPPLYVRRTRQGQVIEVRTHHTADGGLARTYTDVTDYLRAQQALTAARDLAEQASQAKSQFLSGMSHELRTPLNAILGFGQVLLADPDRPLAPAHRPQVQQIVQGAQYLLHLVNDLLDLAIVERGQLHLVPAAVPVAPLLADALGLMQPLAGAAGVRLPTADGSGLLPPGQTGLTVLADRTRLTQVLLNLLSNAVKYNRPGGTVRLAVSPGSPADAGGAARVRIAVSDDGPGLAAADCERVFEPFERLGAGRSAADGVGLGLALSRRLVRAMGGELGVTADGPAGGSRFWLELPRGPDAPAAAAPGLAAAPQDRAAEAPPGPPLLGTGDTVLYIEDNPVNVLLMEAMLPLIGGARLAVATDAADGLRQALALRPRLILLDIELPDMHGFELLRRLQAEPACAGIPVLAVSANALPDDIARGLDAGFARYLTKPLVLGPLRDAIDGVLRAAAAPQSL